MKWQQFYDLAIGARLFYPGDAADALHAAALDNAANPSFSAELTYAAQLAAAHRELHRADVQTDPRANHDALAAAIAAANARQ